MLVKLLTGPDAGTQKHVPRSQEVDVLIGLGLLQVLDETPTPTKAHYTDTAIPFVQEAQWSVVKHPLNGLFHIVLVKGFENTWFTGAPDETKFPGCPAEVIQQFDQLTGNIRAQEEVNSAAKRGGFWQR
jgi:hypothetical protein